MANSSGASPKICVVGAGRWGQNHVKTLAQLGHLGGVVESCAERRAELSKTFSDIQFFGDVSEALSHGFDGYTIATPAETHYDLAKQILSGGNHVLVEKPIALFASQAHHLDTLARKNRAKLMVGHVMLFHPAIQKMKQLIDADKLGKLQYLYSNRLNLGTVRKEENILWSFAPHDISIFQHFVGELPEHVVSRGGAFLQPHIHDSTMTVLEYPSNIKAHCFVSWLHPFKEHRIVAIGSKGMLSFEDSSEQKELLFYEKGIDFINGEPIKRDGPTEVIPYDKAMPLTAEIQYFVDCIQHDKEIEMANGKNAIEVLDVLGRASISLIEDRKSATPTPVAGSRKFDVVRDYFAHETSIVGENATIGARSKVWHFSHVQDGATIGEDVSIGQNVYVAPNVKIGNSCKIQNNVSLYEGVELEDYVFCGPSMVFTNIMEPRCKYPQRGSEFYLKTLVKEGASIGANATIVCGTTIGRHAFIAAGAVVTRDVPDYARMVGVPARRTGWVCECGKALSIINDQAGCLKCERPYSLQGGKLVAEEFSPAERFDAVGNE